jgi:pilus assembly protein CpaE
MSDAVRIYFTGDCDGFETLRGSLAEHPEMEVVGESENVAQASTVLAGGHLDCVVHATRDGSFPAAEIAALREHSRVPVVLVASGGQAAAMLEQALDNDVSDVLLLPQLTHNVVFSIRKAAHVRRQVQTASGQSGRVVTVFSPKGGTGKTVVAVNLATAIAKREGKRTLLLDLDLQFGDAAIGLGIEPEKTIYDLVVAPGELDPEKVAGYVTKHPCGLDLLPAPLRPEDAELVVEGKVTSLLEVVRTAYDVIVVDTSPFFHGPMLATLDRSDELLVLCGLDVPTLKNVRLALQTLELLSFPTSRIRYVMNRANTNVGLKTREVEEALKVKISSELPSDRLVPLSVNRGNPVVLAEPRSDFSRAIGALAKEIAAQARTSPAQAKSGRRRLLTRS